ncbi:hypothetical protein SY91_00578 [Burkholderia cenocepacia]|nr:hypothetical protein SY91_00578 [Burkholderia cenocepacia]
MRAPRERRVGAAHVGLDDERILRHFRIRAFGQHLAALQDGDRVGDPRDHVHVVFHHQDRAAARDLLNQRGHAVDVLVAHPLRGLVEQHQLGLHRQRRRDLERALAAVGQLDGRHVREIGEADLREQVHRAIVEPFQRAFAAPEMEFGAERALQADAHVLQRGQVREHGRDLERADDAAPRDLRGPFVGDVDAVEDDLAGRRRQKFGEEVETGGLARAVRPDQCVDRTAPHTQVDTVHGGEAPEFLRQSACFQNRVAENHVPFRTKSGEAPGSLAQAAANRSADQRAAPGRRGTPRGWSPAPTRMHITEHCRAVGAVQSSGFALIGLAAISAETARGYSPRFFDTCIITR